MNRVIEAAEAAELLVDAAEQYIRTGAHSARALARHQLAALRAALPALPEVPAGWKLVPVEADLRMVVAGGVALTDASEHDLEATVSELKACYAAMLAAAPPAPSVREVGPVALEALMTAARCCESIDAPMTWDEDDMRWRVCTHAGTFYGATLDEALMDFWRSAIQSRDADGNATEPDPFVYAAPPAPAQPADHFPDATKMVAPEQLRSLPLYEVWSPDEQPAQGGGVVAWVNAANLASASVTRERGGAGDTHTWSEQRTDYHTVPLVRATPAPAAPDEPGAGASLLDQFLRSANAAGFKTIHEVPGLMDALRATEPGAGVVEALSAFKADLLRDIEEPDDELLTEFQRAFVQQLRRRKHKPQLESAEKAGARAMFKLAVSRERAAIAAQTDGRTE